MPNATDRDVAELLNNSKEHVARAAGLLANSVEALMKVEESEPGQENQPIMECVGNIMRTLEALAETIIIINWRSAIQNLQRESGSDVIPVEAVIAHLGRHLAAQTVHLQSATQLGQLPGAFKNLLAEGTARCIRTLWAVVQSEDVTRKVCAAAGVDWALFESGDQAAILKVQEKAATMDSASLGMQRMPAEMAEALGLTGQGPNLMQALAQAHAEHAQGK